MKLRRQLLVLSLLVLALPLAAWQFVGELEALLRHALSQAQLQALEALASTLKQRPGQLDLLWQHRNALYLQPLPRGMSLDGYGGDWPQHEPQLTGDGLHGWVGRTADGLWLRLELDDSHMQFSTPDRRGDGLRIRLGFSHGLTQWPLFWEGLGRGDWFQAGQRLSYAVSDLGEGYGVELLLPVQAPRSLSLQWLDDGQPRLQLPESGMYPLTGYDRGLELLLAGHADARYWLLHPRGWVLAQSRNGGPAQPPAEARSWWQNWLYRLLSGSVPLERPGDDRWNLRSPAIRQAAAGDAAVDWMLDRSSGRLVTLAALPVRHKGQVVAIIASRQDNNPLLSLAAQALRQLLVVSAAVFLLAVLVLLAYASLLTRRVRRLQQAVDQAWHDQHGLQAGFQPSRAGDELGDLSRSYARMLDSLAQHTRYLKSLADKLSHELKTPLAVVRSSLENLEQEPDKRQYLQRARSGLDRLQRILQAMTEANRLEQSIQQEQRHRVHLSALLDEYGHVVAETCRRCSIHLQVEPELYIEGAEELLIQMLDKLLDNACSHCSEGGEIRLLLQRQDGHILLAVENDGPPLPAGTPVARLFDSMVSLRNQSHSDGQPHLGLGLHIVQLIARFHHARVTAENRADGRGVRFQLAFPAKLSVARTNASMMPGSNAE